MNEMKEECWVVDAGIINYNDAYTLQKRLVEARAKDTIRDTLLLLEHFPVFTANRETTFKNILAPEEVLKQKGIEVCRTDRGGDVTYHGPGQLVGYNIMDLKKQGKDLHRYIRNMEQVLIDTLAEYDIAASRDPAHPGVWVGREKIAAIGIAVKSSWITMHGFALNISPVMDHYRFIIACGIVGKGITSMEKILGSGVSKEKVMDTVVRHYSKTYNRTPRNISREDLSW